MAEAATELKLLPRELAALAADDASEDAALAALDASDEADAAADDAPAVIDATCEESLEVLGCVVSLKCQCYVVGCGEAHPATLLGDNLEVRLDSCEAALDNWASVPTAKTERARAMTVVDFILGFGLRGGL